MPTPFSAMASLAAELDDADPTDETSVESFYVTVFPAFSEEIREEIFSWLTAIDSDLDPKELARFADSLRSRQDFAIQHTDIVTGMADMVDNVDGSPALVALL